MAELDHRPTAAATSLRPSRVSLWRMDDGRFGLDLTYRGATAYADAEAAQAVLEDGGLLTSFRQELDGAWSVRLGPVPRAAMVQVVTRIVC